MRSVEDNRPYLNQPYLNRPYLNQLCFDQPYFDQPNSKRSDFRPAYFFSATESACS